MRAILDEMLPAAVARELCQRGHDVIAVAERPDLRALDDAAQFDLAQAEERAMVTRDIADYLRLDRQYRAAGREHAGIVLVSSRFPPDAVGPLVGELDDFLAGDAPYASFVHWL